MLKTTPIEEEGPTLHNVARTLQIQQLNPSLLCSLCNGYLIDATTIIECLHSFCRSCIVKYLQSHKYCPICEVQVHKTKPLLNIRADDVLQDIVYKLVPGLFQNEMRRRREFYNRNRTSNIISTESNSDDSSVCLSLEYDEQSKRKKFSSHHKRFLRCPRAVRIHHLQKLLRSKYALDEKHHRVDVMCAGEKLNTEMTVGEMATMYLWRTKSPLHLTYKIFTAISNTQNAIPKVDNAKKGENVILKNTDNDWKEVQLQISENGVMSVTGIENSQRQNSNEADFLNNNKIELEKSKEESSKNKNQSHESQNFSNDDLGPTKAKKPKTEITKETGHSENISKTQENSNLDSESQELHNQSKRDCKNENTSKIDYQSNTKSSQDATRSHSNSGITSGSNIVNSKNIHDSKNMDSQNVDKNEKSSSQNVTQKGSDQNKVKDAKSQNNSGQNLSIQNSCSQDRNSQNSSPNLKVQRSFCQNDKNSVENKNSSSQLSNRSEESDHNTNLSKSSQNSVTNDKMSKSSSTNMEKNSSGQNLLQNNNYSNKFTQNISSQNFFQNLNLSGPNNVNTIQQDRGPNKTNSPNFVDSTNEKLSSSKKNDHKGTLGSPIGIQKNSTIESSIGTQNVYKLSTESTSNNSQINSKTNSTENFQSIPKNISVEKSNRNQKIDSPNVSKSGPIESLSSGHPLKIHSQKNQKIPTPQNSSGAPQKTPVEELKNNKNQNMSSSTPGIQLSRVGIVPKKIAPNYKTLRDPPKAWNPQLPPAPPKNPESNSKNDQKPAKFFKARNMPRFLGNPASGVKPLFNVPPENEKGGQTSEGRPSTPRPFTKIDPKTLKPMMQNSPQLKINQSTVPIFNKQKMGPSVSNGANRRKDSPPSPLLNNRPQLSYTPPNPFIPNLQSPNLAPGHPHNFLYPCVPPLSPHSLFYSPPVPRLPRPQNSPGVSEKKINRAT